MNDTLEFYFCPRHGRKEGDRDAYIIYSLMRGQGDPLAICRYGADAITITDSLNMVKPLNIPMFMDDDQLIVAYKIAKRNDDKNEELHSILVEINRRGLEYQ